jgi:hypothetical protein
MIIISYLIMQIICHVIKLFVIRFNNRQLHKFICNDYDHYNVSGKNVIVGWQTVFVAGIIFCRAFTQISARFQSKTIGPASQCPQVDFVRPSQNSCKPQPAKRQSDLTWLLQTHFFRPTCLVTVILQGNSRSKQDLYWRKWQITKLVVLVKQCAQWHWVTPHSPRPRRVTTKGPTSWQTK